MSSRTSPTILLNPTCRWIDRLDDDIDTRLVCGGTELGESGGDALVGDVGVRLIAAKALQQADDENGVKTPGDWQVVDEFGDRRLAG